LTFEIRSWIAATVV